MESRRIPRPSIKIKFKPYLALRARIFSIANSELIEYIQQLLEANPFTEEANFVDLDNMYIENITQEEYDLYSFLTHQINILGLDEKQRKVADIIVSNIDEAGFLREPVKRLAELSGESASIVKEVLKIVQSLDPPGVAARDLPECFIIQLERECKLPSNVKKIISEELEDFIKLPIETAAKKFRLPPEYILEMRERIQWLNPSPGLAFREPREVAKVPDLIVEKIDGSYSVVLNKSFRKDFEIARNYESMLKKIEDSTSKKEMEELLNHALWSRQAIENRDKLLLSIGKRIVELNADFFDRKQSFPEKISLEELSRDLEIDYSALSRLVQNKYLKCPKGILPLHFFVRHKLVTFNDEQIRCLIRELVEKEDKKNPLTDEQIEFALKEQGLDIKRRTVTKYRNQLEIPPASKRRID